MFKTIPMPYLMENAILLFKEAIKNNAPVISELDGKKVIIRIEELPDKPQQDYEYITEDGEHIVYKDRVTTIDGKQVFPRKYCEEENDFLEELQRHYEEKVRKGYTREDAFCDIEKSLELISAQLKE